jgi:anti-sigma B factor antagonist
MEPQSSKLHIEERHVEDITILSLSGEITLDDGDLAFGKKVDDLLAKGHRRFLIDLAGVTYIDSSGVGMLVAELKLVGQKGGAMKLIRLSQSTHGVLGMLKLLTIFETFEDEASGLRSFAWGARSEN